MSIKQLRDYLAEQGEGLIAAAETVKKLLAASWPALGGSGQTRMTAEKLLRRADRFEWYLPMLDFTIERHPGQAFGSTRAPLHRWRANVEAATAHWVEIGYRQLRPMQRRLDVGPLADELAKLISSRAPDPRLRWAQHGTVTVRMGSVLPSGSAVKETLSGRRKRLRSRLEQRLAEKGWRMVRANVFAPPGRTMP
jgi:hypothetical protein